MYVKCETITLPVIDPIVRSRALMPILSRLLMIVSFVPTDIPSKNKRRNIARVIIIPTGFVIHL
jgi:hypothetical protein